MIAIDIARTMFIKKVCTLRSHVAINSIHLNTVFIFTVFARAVQCQCPGRADEDTATLHGTS